MREASSDFGLGDNYNHQPSSSSFALGFFFLFGNQQLHAEALNPPSI
jgi:hypothetical protein